MNEKPAYRLRKVVGDDAVAIRNKAGEILAWSPREVLECGHMVRVPKDWYGETSTEKRRCRQCVEEES